MGPNGGQHLHGFFSPPKIHYNTCKKLTHPEKDVFPAKSSAWPGVLEISSKYYTDASKQDPGTNHEATCM